MKVFLFLTILLFSFGIASANVWEFITGYAAADQDDQKEEGGFFSGIFSFGGSDESSDEEPRTFGQRLRGIFSWSSDRDSGGIQDLAGAQQTGPGGSDSSDSPDVDPMDPEQRPGFGFVDEGETPGMPSARSAEEALSGEQDIHISQIGGSAECTDSDGGDEKLIFGVVTIPGNQFRAETEYSDYCFYNYNAGESSTLDCDSGYCSHREYECSGTSVNVIDTFDVICDGGVLADSDSDGVGDHEDNCPTNSNQDQLNSDSDEFGGDVCDDCPLDSDNDLDGDGFCSNLDNCPDDANADQVDLNGNGVGDVCDSEALPDFNLYRVSGSEAAFYPYTYLGESYTKVVYRVSISNDGIACFDLSENGGLSSRVDYSETSSIRYALQGQAFSGELCPGDNTYVTLTILLEGDVLNQGGEQITVEINQQGGNGAAFVEESDYTNNERTIFLTL
ncbi:hypothetical protein HOD38_05450 [archaeon]|nr:hypothetical protein [archaeon]MBT4397686.1 hypothetical protein [archaeon]MBT4441618.1 hypothetical protein [archaeon]